MDLTTLIADVYAASSNPTSNLFLPVAILEQPVSLDPWTIPTLSLGDLAAIDASLPGNLCNALTQNSIASPASAAMQLTNVQVSGMSNAVLGQPVVSGTQVTGSVAFGGASLPAGLSVQSQVQLTAAFTVSVSCCPSDNGSACSGSSTPSTIAGILNVTFQGSSLAYTLVVAADFTTTATQLAFTAASSTSKVTASNQAPISAGPLLGAALQSAAGQQLLLTSLNTAFAASATLGAAGTTLTAILQTTANPTLLAYVAAQLSKAAVSPSSSLYLPKQVQGASNPTLEPYAAGSWNFGDVSSFYPSAGMNICGSIGAQAGEDMIGVPSSPVDLTLSNVLISGISNVLASPLLTAGNSIQGLATVGQISSWSIPHLVVSGDFSLTVSCCQTTDFKTCSGAPEASTGNGTFSGTITNAAITANIDITATGQQMQGTVTTIRFLCDPNVLSATNLLITLNITTMPPSEAQLWNVQAAKIFNSPQGAAAIVNSIQTQVNSPSVLTQVSTLVTNALNSALGSMDTTTRNKLFLELNRYQA